MQREETRYNIEVPHLGSVILTHSWEGPIPSLKDFAPEDRPNSPIVFWTFRIMVGLGMLMIAAGFWSVWLRWRNKLWSCRPFLKFIMLMGPSGLIALLAGWLTTEIGRQPWTVYGLLRTADSVSSHAAAELSVTLILFILVYFAVFGAGIIYLLRLVRIGPKVGESEQTETGGPGQPRQPMRPLSAVTESDSEPNPELDRS
jgi:cytochrome d ubiquinol oxidase subunit I